MSAGLTPPLPAGQASNSESETEGGDKEVDLSTLRNLLLRTTEGGQLQEKPNAKNVRHCRQPAKLGFLGTLLTQRACQFNCNFGLGWQVLAVDAYPLTGMRGAPVAELARFWCCY